jgi:hypothetical protein
MAGSANLNAKNLEALKPARLADLPLQQTPRAMRRRGGRCGWC